MRETVYLWLFSLLRRFVERVCADKHVLRSLRPFEANYIEITLVPNPQKLQAVIITQGELDRRHGGVIVKGSQMFKQGRSGPLDRKSVV